MYILSDLIRTFSLDPPVRSKQPILSHSLSTPTFTTLRPASTQIQPIQGPYPTFSRANSMSALPQQIVNVSQIQDTDNDHRIKQKRAALTLKIQERLIMMQTSSEVLIKEKKKWMMN
eukprot:TRINITY_DN5747_c0_g1_i1.p1 TRINITY_DN5747_c0_g1~~TRINITY_DN5747_c0_g1_i1.p1  ORF type:complete len:117 (+),score=18.54 TRINITY_DN5747_c0_g1_i1:39-389(+)